MQPRQARAESLSCEERNSLTDVNMSDKNVEDRRILARQYAQPTIQGRSENHTLSCVVCWHVAMRP